MNEEPQELAEAGIANEAVTADAPAPEKIIDDFITQEQAESMGLMGSVITDEQVAAAEARLKAAEELVVAEVFKSANSTITSALATFTEGASFYSQCINSIFNKFVVLGMQDKQQQMMQTDIAYHMQEVDDHLRKIRAHIAFLVAAKVPE